MNRRLKTVNNKIQRLSDKKALIEEELGLLYLEKEEIEDQEILAICKKNDITLQDLMKKINEENSEKEKEKIKNEKIIEE